jgi:hypothetical protein
MIESLIDFFGKPQEESKNEVPAGFCPNCWGTQEYDKHIRKLYDDKQIDINNHLANYSFIQDFVVEQIKGIQLIK